MELIVPFDSDDREFARGFEAGVLWQRLRDPEDFALTIRASNIEMAMRMAEERGRCAQGQDLDDDWVFTTFCTNDG